MVILGLVLIIVGVIAILSAVFVSQPGTGGELLGFSVSTLEAFLVGVAAGALVIWGFSILKWGTRRSLSQRRERRELTKLNAKLERAEAERQRDEGD
jgi:zinc transporter ZupT